MTNKLDWEKYRVADIGEIKTGKTPKTAVIENYGGNVPFLTPSDNMNIKRVTKTSKTLTELGLNEVKNCLLPKDSVCVSCIGSDLGKVVITTKPTITNQQINSIIVDTKKFNVDFVYYTMLILGKFLNFHSKTSTAVPIVNKSNFSNYEIMAPDLITQEKIAKILSSLDDKIALNNKINKNLEHQAQAIFKSWFVDFEPFDYTMPEEWKVTDIYSISDIIYGAPFASKMFNSQKRGLPIIRIRDLKTQQFETYTEEIHPKGYLLKPGDIVVGMDGEFKPYLWGNQNAWLNQRMCVFANKNPNDKAFVYYTIKPLLDFVEKTEMATTVIHIGKKDFDEFKIIYPVRSVLDKFGNITTPIFNKIVLNKIENNNLTQLRNTLLSKLINGEIDVSDVNLDELSDNPKGVE